MDKFKEEAKKIADKFAWAIEYGETFDKLVNAVDEAFQRTDKAAREDCAGIAEKRFLHYETMYTPGGLQGAIAQAIRASIGEKP